MNAREVIARRMAAERHRGIKWEELGGVVRSSYREKADKYLSELDAADFVIMSKQDVEAVREAMECAVSRFDACQDTKVRNTPLGINGLRDAIRSLKSGGRDAD